MVHAHPVFIILDHEGEKTDLDRTTGLKERGTGGFLSLIAFKVGVKELTVHGQADPFTVREAENLGCHDALAPRSSVKVHLSILQVTQLLHGKPSLAMLRVLRILAEDQLFHVRDKRFLNVRQVKQRWLSVGEGCEEQRDISFTLGAGTLPQDGFRGIGRYGLLLGQEGGHHLHPIH